MDTTLAPTAQQDRLLPRAALVAGLTAMAMAIYQVATPGSPQATFGSLSDWIRDLLFLGYLLAVITAFTAARRTDLATTIPSWLVRGGYSLIALGAAYGLAVQDDPDWFFVLAGPGLLASTIGHVWFGISGVRRRVLPLWAGLLAAVGGAVAIIMAELGTSVLIGAFWIWVAFSPSE